jgi:hypothetical protein
MDSELPEVPDVFGGLGFYFTGMVSYDPLEHRLQFHDGPQVLVFTGNVLLHGLAAVEQ